MSRLTSLSSAANVAVVGASGGIGRAIVGHLQEDDNVATVHALSRSPIPSGGKITSRHLDITEERTIRDATEVLGDGPPLDLVVVASGVLHRGDALQPEKSLRELDAGNLLEVFSVNAAGPAIVAKHFLPLLRRGHKAVFAALSARVGSIGDNRLGGWASYRASKAALNMLLKTLAIEQARRTKEAIVVALHPGTVDTALSGPFSSRVPEGQVFTPPDAASKLLAVVDGLTAADTGGFFAWDGSRIPY